ncbi:pyridoxal phosphate-dependent aminotransferase [Cellulomonas shaoxiangyii]|uniref:Aminotransferase n=1 Tax=Cellulomonas shaoxiangyii TaxID=2566013 RepID=A0A4V1CMP6_9CELL|nr:pyridoxal phosphate-dependent aminotransferase [Cellulomonas shaoxiangyii]QCB93675.1 pyridoxal phosphate-dependent aminotransferase [Cellulomonas shaoxiangyii]TGY86156.1 pyridoxal phosphate-dependent aminotransferase [Cellulomonas shaoxiangyii]
MPRPAPSSPVARIPRSGIRTVMDLALRDPEAIHLEIGEPDARPAAHVVDAVAASAAAGLTGYTSSIGMASLREVAAERVTARQGREVTPDRVVVTHGAMHGLAMALATLLGPGDEVLVPDPVFPNWEMAAVAASARPRRYRTHAAAGFVPRPADVEARITPRTRALLLCSPNNPTGAVYPPDVLARLVDLARRHDLWVLSDECYEAITYGVPHVSPAVFDTDGRVLVFHSLSKTYALTGWRAGYAVVPDPAVVEAIGHLAEATVACPSTTGQLAALAALTGPQDGVASAVASYRERRDAAVTLLRQRGVRHVVPDGAFYLMVDVGRADTEAFALDLLAQRHVAVAPGATFGDAAAGMVRVSLAAPRGDLLEGLARLADQVATGRGGAAGPAGLAAAR